MLPGQPSRTVLLPAIRRAAHQLLERVAGFEIVEQILNWDASAHENGRAAKDFGVTIHH